MIKSKMSPSMMCADIVNLDDCLTQLKDIGAEYLHIDVMDGVFVPNIMLGTEYVKRLRKCTDIPLDIHLMIEKPEDKIAWFEPREGDMVSLHYESTPHPLRALQRIRSYGAMAGIALNPGTPISAAEDLLPSADMVLIMTVNPGYAGQTLAAGGLDKLRRTRRYLDDRGYEKISLQVDGNASFDNLPLMREAGADFFVLGSSSLFHKDYDLTSAAKIIRGLIK